MINFQKKVTIDARMLCSSGIGTVIQNVTRRLISIHDNWNFFIIASKTDVEKTEWLLRDNVTIIPTDTPIYSIKEQCVLPSLIPHDTDLLWVPHYNIPLFYKGKMVVTVHDVFHLAMPQFVKGFDKRIYAHFMFRMAVKKASHIICVSQFTENELIKYVHAGSNKISVIYNGVDPFWQEPMDCLHAIYKKPYLLYVGNVKPHKNLRRLIQAFQEIADRIPQDLVIVGKKDGFITGDPLVARMADLMPDRIHFTGFLSNEDLKNYYNFADALVFPSLYEGFGLPPLEAMASGCRKVICSNIPALREVYGDSVEYFNPLDVHSLSQVILNTLADKTLKMIPDSILFNWDICASKYDKIFTSIILQKF